MAEEFILKTINHNSAKQFVKFCIVGTIGLSTNVCVFFVLYRLLHINHVVASVTGAFVASIGVFFLNRRWTFQDRYANITTQSVRFAITMICSYILTGLSMYLFTDIIMFKAEISLLITIAVTTTFNFCVCKMWAFAN